MRIFQTALLFSILPFLSGCFTQHAIFSVHNTVDYAMPDRIYSVDKAVVSKDNQLVIFLEGCLSNSPERTPFSLSVPLKEIRELASHYSLPATNGKSSGYWGETVVLRSAIRADRVPQGNSVDYEKAVPVGLPILALDGAVYYNRVERPGFFVKYANPLPNSTQTLYPVIEYRYAHHTNWPARIGFIFVDTSLEQKYTFIHIEQVMDTITKRNDFYFLLPLTIPLDIATLPVQIPIVIFGLLTMHGT